MITGTGFKETPDGFASADLGKLFDPTSEPIELILPKKEAPNVTTPH